MPWLEQFLVLWAQMMDGANFLITDQYPQINSNVRYVNVQYHISDFLEIVSIDILGHGGAMNIIHPKNLF